MVLNFRDIYDELEEEESVLGSFTQPQQRQEQDASTTGSSNPDQPGADEGGRNAVIDILAGVGNGVFNAVDSTVGLTGIDIGLEDIFGETETFAGKAVEGLTQFATGFVPVFGALSKAGKFGQIGRGIVAGAAADFAVFDGQEERLSNLIQEVPGLANPVTEFLAADEDDSDVEGRIKNVLEGAAIGSLFDGFVFGLRQLKAVRKARAEGKTAEEAMESARRAARRMEENRQDALGPMEPRFGSRMLRTGGSEAVDLNAELEFHMPRKTRKRGSGNLFRRLELEANLIGRHVRDDLKRLRTFTDELGDSYFEDVGISIHKNLSSAGRFEFGSQIIRIAKRTIERGDLEPTLIHELWHKLSDHLPDADVASVQKAYRKALEKKPLIREVIDNGTRQIGQERYNELISQFGKDQVQEVFSRSGDGKYTFRLEGDNYRFSNEDEWFAEVMTEVTQGRLDFLESAAPSGTVRRIFQDLGVIFRDLYVYAKEKLGFAGPEQRIFNDFLRGRNIERTRDGGILGRAAANLEDEVPEEVLSSLDFDADQVRSFIQKGTDLQEGALFQDVDLTVNPRRRPTENSRLQDETRELLGLSKDHYSIIEAAGDEGAAAIEFHRRERLMPIIREQVEAESRGARADADIAQKRAEEAVLKYQQVTGLSSKEEALGMLQRRLGSITDLRARQLEVEAEVEFQRMGLATAARDQAAHTRVLQEKIDRGTVTEAELATWAAMDRAMNELTSEIMGIKSSQGRALRNLKDIPNYIGGPGGAPVLQAYKRIMAEAGGRKGIERRIKALSAQVAEKGDGILVHEARKANRSNVLNVTLEYWMNSILSGLKTLNINAIGGAAVTMYRPLEGMLGAAARGHWKEAQTYVETYMDLLDSTSEAWRYAKQSFGTLLNESENVLLPDSRAFQDGEARRAISAEAFGKADDSPMGKFLNGTGAVVRLPSRSLQATDEFFKQLNARAIVKRGLRREGLNKGLNGEELGRFIDDGLDKIIVDGELQTVQTLQRRAFETAKAANPGATEQELRKLAREAFNDLWEKEGKHTEPLVQAAKEYAEDVTFTKELPEGSIGKWLQDVGVAHPVLRFFLPFVRTPVNLLSAAYDRSPIAVARHAGEVIRKNVLGPNFPRLTEAQGKLTRDLSSPDPAVVTEAYGRMYMATGSTFALLTAAGNGNLTGRGPTDKELRRQLEATGWQPYSVKIGDTYVSYNRLDPFATVIGIVADFHDYGRWADVSDQNQLEHMLWGTISALTQNMTNKSYVTGIRSLVELLQDPEANVGTEAARLTSSFIPSIVGQAAGVTDPYARELRSFSDSFANRVPYLSDNLDPVRNVLGEPVDRVRSLGGETIPLFNAFLPIAARSTKDKKIHQELALLSWPFSPPPKSKQGQDLTQIQLPSGHSAYDRWSELTGQVRIGRSTLKSDLRRLISSSRYQALPPESEPGAPSPRVEEIRKLLRRYRNRAWSQLLREVPELRQATTTFERERTLRRRGGRAPIGF